MAPRQARILLILATLLLPLTTWSSARASENSRVKLFETAWRLVDERYFDLERAGVDWNSVYSEYRPLALNAASEEALYSVLERMYEELNDDHSVFVPPAKVAEITAQYGQLPCVAHFGFSPGSGAPALLAPTLASGSPPAERSPRGALTGGRERRLANVTYRLTPEGAGYVRLPDLASDGVAAAVRGAVMELEEEGAWSLLLDLRGNPGGRLLSMMEVAGIFTRGLLWRAVTNWSLPLPYPAIGSVATELPLAVLIDGGVNSAAEGLAGALQFKQRAVIVGERSAGNVEALLPFCLRDGSQAWIATGVLAPLVGRTWEGQGVLPDVPSPASQAEARALEWLQEQR